MGEGNNAKALECKEFLEFLTLNRIDPELYKVSYKSIPRYARWNSFFKNSDDDTDDSITPFIQDHITSEFFSLDRSVKLTSLPAYTEGRIYGMDLSSGLAVQFLDPQPSETILDYCCSPGMKFAYIADRMRRTGKLVGFDISANRLFTCKNLLHKYGVFQSAENREDEWQVSLHQVDGREPLSSSKFLPAPVASTFYMKTEGFKRKRLNKSMRRKRQKILDEPVPEFDKILVDAECTHDGSQKHLELLLNDDDSAKFKEYVSVYLNPDRVSEIIENQKKVLTSAFQLLKVDGVLVYSTCSLSQTQNEDVVSWFLAKESDAKLLPVTSKDLPVYAEESKTLHGTVRCGPATNTSGLFIAKLTKTVASSLPPPHEE